MNSCYRYLGRGLMIALLIISVARSAANVTFTLLATPSSTKTYTQTALYPVLLCQSSDSSLSAMSISYSWDNSTWTELAATPTPDRGDWNLVGNALTIGQTGTLYLKAWA